MVERRSSLTKESLELVLVYEDSRDLNPATVIEDEALGSDWLPETLLRFITLTFCRRLFLDAHSSTKSGDYSFKCLVLVSTFGTSSFAHDEAFVWFSSVNVW
jgi:hypothetical protein